MRLQWVSRVLGNAHIIPSEVMSPFASEVLEKAARRDKTLVISIDQSHISAGFEMLMVSLRYKTRGFSLAKTRLRYADRIERLVLIMALALYWAISCGVWDELNHPLPYEKKSKKAARCRMSLFKRGLRFLRRCLTLDQKIPQLRGEYA